MVHHGVIVDQIRSVLDILPCVLVDEILPKVVMVYTLKGVHAYLIEYGNMTTVVARGANAAVIVVDSMLGYRGSLIRKAKSHLLHSTPNIQRPCNPTTIYTTPKNIGIAAGILSNIPLKTR